MEELRIIPICIGIRTADTMTVKGTQDNPYMHRDKVQNFTLHILQQG